MAKRGKKDKPASPDDLNGIVDPAKIQKIRQRQRIPEIEICWVLEENWAATQLFLKCRRRWKYGFSSIPTGLDIKEVGVIIERTGLDPFPPEDFERFLQLEDHYLTELSD